jgi:toxin-antitoxin system PIN domain toxin
MILPDVNVLVYAFRESAKEHAIYARWLHSVRQEGEELLLPDAVLAGFLRVATHTGIPLPAASMHRALAFVSILRSDPNTREIDNTDAVWAQFDRLAADDIGVKGNVVPDAYLAAVAISHKARIATRDRGFGRFPGLRWFDPAAA